jgi:hypothetical protein
MAIIQVCLVPTVSLLELAQSKEGCLCCDRRFGYRGVKMTAQRGVNLLNERLYKDFALWSDDLSQFSASRRPKICVFAIG